MAKSETDPPTGNRSLAKLFIYLDKQIYHFRVTVMEDERIGRERLKEEIGREQRWEFIKENKKNSTKKVIKKKRKLFLFFLVRFLGRDLVFLFS